MHDSAASPNPPATPADTARPAFAGADHPKLPAARVGVILSNLGTPDATDYWSMRRYLGEFLSDRRVIDYSPLFWQPLLQLVILTKRPFSSGRNYASIWDKERNESPLLVTTRGQAAAVAERARAVYGDRVLVDFAMRYGNPSTESVVTGLRERGCDRIVFFPLYPQYSAPTTATANDQAFRALMAMKWQPSIRTVPAYYDDPLYIEALAGSVERAYAGLAHRPDLLVTSYHGMPERYLAEGDPYHCQCRKTTRLLRDRLGFTDDEIVVTFQSRFGPEEWLQPYTDKTVEKLAQDGIKRIAVLNPGFVSDCLETLEEIADQAGESFLHNGGEKFTHIPCLNDSPEGMTVLEKVVRRELSGWV